MSSLLDHLGKDTLPPEMIDEFIHWCVFEQARPALINILEQTGLHDRAGEVQLATTYVTLASTARGAGEAAHIARQSTGPLGLSAAEAAAFLTDRLAKAATEAEWDPEGVAFFSSQVVGWSGLAQTNFLNPASKAEAEKAARQAQEEKLIALWKIYGEQNNTAPDGSD